MGSQFPDHYEFPISPWGVAPGVINEEYKSLTTTGSLNAIYSSDTIKVVPTLGVVNEYTISWPAVTDAISYTIFAGFSLFLSQATEVVTVTGLEYVHSYRISLPPSSVLYVWVRVNKAASTTYIQADPASTEHIEDYFSRNDNPLEASYSNLTVDNDYMRFVAAEIRRRAIVMQQNDGEEFTIFSRRWTGTPCTCASTDANMVDGPDAIQGGILSPDQGIGEEPTDYADPKFGGLTRCPNCLGTGIVGGYYYGLTTLMRYGNLPARQILFKDFTIDVPQNFNTWTVWEPRLHSQDVAFRKKTGEYFQIEDAGRGEWRGVPFHQEAKMNLLPPDDHRCQLSDEFIEAAEGSI